MALALVLLFSMNAGAFAALVVPRAPYEGETNMPGDGGDTWTFVECDLQFKVDEGYVEPGEWTEDGITVSVYANPDGKTVFDFESETVMVKKVAVKGGNATYPYPPMPWGEPNAAIDGQWIYDYTALGGVASDTGLRAPNNDAGNQADLSNLVFCFMHEPPPPPPDGSISGFKWYDRNKNGERDDGEPLLTGWRINLTDGVETWCLLTNEAGAFTFSGLAPATYWLSEASPPVGSGWVQTWPAGNIYEIELEPDEARSGFRFGNVCEVTATGGFTLGYWSNRNGSADLTAYNRTRHSQAWQDHLDSYNLVNRNGSAFDANTYAGFRTWLLDANSTNMSYMLSVQMAATLLNMEVKGASYTGHGVVWNGEWKSIGTLIGEANTFLALNPVTRDGSVNRAQAEAYKNLFDDLNNNRRMLIPYDPCPVPEWTCGS